MRATGEDVRHFLGLDGLDAAAINALLERARTWRATFASEKDDRTLLVGRFIANVFFENSTRTRISFTIAARKLGADVVDVLGESSSRSKGETLFDTCLNLVEMGISAFVVRTSASGALHQLARAIDRPLINAGDGRHEHPTQGLLDLLTLQDHLGDLAGKRIAIVGDIANSRVARSAIFGLTALGADVVLVGPPRLAPETFEEITNGEGRVTFARDLDPVLPEIDSIMMLRVQFERDAGEAIASIDEYRRGYCLNAERAAQLPEHAIILHPGPLNRGLEIDSRVADDPQRSVILKQVANGVAVRAAVLEAACAPR